MQYDRNKFGYTSIHNDVHGLGDHFGIMIASPYANKNQYPKHITIFSKISKDAYIIDLDTMIISYYPTNRFLTETELSNILEYLKKNQMHYFAMWNNPYLDLGEISD